MDGAAALPHFQDQREGLNKGVRPGVQRSGPKRLHLSIKVTRHLADLGPAQPGDPQLLGQPLHPPRADSADSWSRPPRQEPTRPAGAAPTATPESNCPAAAWAQPDRCCRRRYPNRGAGNRYECYCGPGCATQPEIALPPNRVTYQLTQRPGVFWPQRRYQPATAGRRWQCSASDDRGSWCRRCWCSSQDGHW